MWTRQLYIQQVICFLQVVCFLRVEVHEADTDGWLLALFGSDIPAAAARGPLFSVDHYQGTQIVLLSTIDSL